MPSTTPLCRCRVLYIGSSVPIKSKDGLQGIQEPLRQLYPIDHNSDTKGVDSWLNVWVNGLQLEYVEEEKELFFPIQTLHYCAAVRYVNVAGYALEGGGEKFLPLDSPFANLPDTSHPPIFASILRRTQGVKVLECHAFICTNAKAANALVRCCFHAYADSMYLGLTDGQTGSDGNLNELHTNGGLKAIKEKDSSRSSSPKSDLDNGYDDSGSERGKEILKWSEAKLKQNWQNRQQTGDYDTASISSSLVGKYKKKEKPSPQRGEVVHRPPSVAASYSNALVPVHVWKQERRRARSEMDLHTASYGDGTMSKAIRPYSHSMSHPPMPFVPMHPGARFPPAPPHLMMPPRGPPMNGHPMRGSPMNGHPMGGPPMGPPMNGMGPRFMPPPPPPLPPGFMSMGPGGPMPMGPGGPMMGPGGPIGPGGPMGPPPPPQSLSPPPFMRGGPMPHPAFMGPGGPGPYFGPPTPSPYGTFNRPKKNRHSPRSPEPHYGSMPRPRAFEEPAYMPGQMGHLPPHFMGPPGMMPPYPPFNMEPPFDDYNYDSSYRRPKSRHRNGVGSGRKSPAGSTGSGRQRSDSGDEQKSPPVADYWENSNMYESSGGLFKKQHLNEKAFSTSIQREKEIRQDNKDHDRPSTSRSGVQQDFSRMNGTGKKHRDFEEHIQHMNINDQDDRAAYRGKEISRGYLH